MESYESRKIPSRDNIDFNKLHYPAKKYGSGYIQKIRAKSMVSVLQPPDNE